MPRESEPVCVEPAPEAQLDSSKVWPLQESFSRTHDFSSDLGYSQKINDMCYNQLISDPSTYVEKRAQRSGELIFLRHMDDVVGTGPDEHLMIDFEHMKTSLYLTDSETASDQCQFMRSRVLRSQSLRRRTDGTRRALQGTSLQRFGSSRDGFRLGKTTFYSAGDQADSNTSKYDALQYNSVHERNVCR